jgi:hypothetical protein
MTDSVRGNFVSAAVKGVHVLDAFANLLGRTAEIDAGIASPLVWTFIDIPAGVGDEIAAADKEGKVNALAILIQLGSKVGELLPALELGTVSKAMTMNWGGRSTAPAGARAPSATSVANAATSF